MYKSLLFSPEYSPLLSGHETFPLRYGWLKKAVDAVDEQDFDRDSESNPFTNEDAIARFGVGKNMVSSIRHWGLVTDVIDFQRSSKSMNLTDFGRWLFSDQGMDPYMENPSTCWLIHWKLCSRATKTTWFWAFNHCHYVTFEREQMALAIQRLVQERGWRKTSPTTIKNDVACFIRTYVSVNSSDTRNREDALESPLTELNLLNPIGSHSGFTFVRGTKPSLVPAVFLFAIRDFWESHHPDSNTLSFESLLHEPHGPGRVFLLDENELMDQLIQLEDASNGAYRWSETAGLKQLLRIRGVSEQDTYDILKDHYKAM